MFLRDPISPAKRQKAEDGGNPPPWEALGPGKGDAMPGGPTVARISLLVLAFTPCASGEKQAPDPQLIRLQAVQFDPLFGDAPDFEGLLPAGPRHSPEAKRKVPGTPRRDESRPTVARAG